MHRPSVLIVRPEPSRGLSTYYRNLGLTMAGSHVREHDLDVRLADLSFDDLDDHLREQPAAALFSLYIDDFARGIELAQWIKRVSPNTVTAVGGPHVTLLGDSVRRITDAFDLVGIGDCLPEAMRTLTAMINGPRRPVPGVVRSPSNTARMDLLTPDYTIWPPGRYFPVFPVEFSRGCRQHCPFCTDPVLRRGVATDPVERTMSTLHSLVAEHDRVWVRFVDSSMSSLGSDLDRLLDALIRSDLPIEWSAYAYPHDITRDLAARMRRAGCRALFLGIESLAQGVRVGKHHTKRPEEAAAAVDNLHDHDIFVHANFIIGLPGETPRTVAETMHALQQISFDSVGGGPFYLTPGSTFERRAHKYGIEILDPDWALGQHINFWNGEHEYFRTATLTQAQMRTLAGEFRQHVQDSGASCWNLSDYAVLCWRSVGGHIDDLARLWAAPEGALAEETRLAVEVLKEKSGVQMTREQAHSFVPTTARGAAHHAAAGTP